MWGVVQVDIGKAQATAVLGKGGFGQASGATSHHITVIGVFRSVNLNDPCNSRVSNID